MYAKGQKELSFHVRHHWLSSVSKTIKLKRFMNGFMKVDASSTKGVELFDRICVRNAKKNSIYGV